MGRDAAEPGGKRVRRSSSSPESSVVLRNLGLRARCLDARTRRSGLTSERVAAHADLFSDPSRLVLRNPIIGRKVCWPGFSRRHDWKVPGNVPVRQLLGALVFVVGDDGRVDWTGQQFRITAVLSSECGGPAPPSFVLWQCASAEDVVQVIFGEHVQEFVGLPCEQRELLDLSGVSTPPTPPPGARRKRRRGHDSGTSS